MNFLNITGLKTFLNKIKEIFATLDSVSKFELETETYVTNIDYTQIAFNTDFIVGTNSSELDAGLLDQMILL